jgi:hypothetical protein
MDVNTTDARAYAMAPRLDISAQTADNATWIDPTTGSICLLEESGYYEVWHRERLAFKPVVVGSIPQHDAWRLLRNPYSEEARRAAATAIVAVLNPGEPTG